MYLYTYGGTGRPTGTGEFERLSSKVQRLPGDTTADRPNFSWSPRVSAPRPRLRHKIVSTMVSLLARIALVFIVATSVRPFSTETPPAKKAWFPVRPADALPTEYDSVVRGAFVRHVVVETEEMADLGLKTYLKGGSDS